MQGENEHEHASLPGAAPSYEAAGQPDGGRWALRRDSLETARASIEAIEKATDAVDGAAALAGEGGGGSNIELPNIRHEQQVWRADADAAWKRVYPRSGSGSGSGSDEDGDEDEHWYNKVTEEMQSARPTDRQMQRVAETASSPLSVLEEEELEEEGQRLPPMHVSNQHDRPEQLRKSRSAEVFAPDRVKQKPVSMAGLAIAKDLADKKRRQITQSTFKVKRGSLGRVVSRPSHKAKPPRLHVDVDMISDPADQNEEPVKTTTVSRGHSGLSALFVAGDGDITMEMSSGSHGQLEFQSGRQVVNPKASSLLEAKQATFVRLQTPDTQPFRQLSSTGQQARVRCLRELADFMRYSWRLKVPSVIFSLTGSATPFELRPKYKEAFAQSLLHATRNTNAWVFTGGTNTGVMKLVGDALGNQRQMETVIGVATWGALHGRTELDLLDRDDVPRDCLENCTVELRGLEQLGHQKAREDFLTDLYSECGVVVGLTVGLDPDDRTASWEISKGKIICYITFKTEMAAERACNNTVHTRAGGPAYEHATYVSIQRCKGGWSSTDNGIKREHAAKILGSRGSVALPFEYIGKRANGEGMTGSSLDRNHSHYLLVDDGSEDEFGKEIVIRNELIQFFSFRDDMMTCSSADLADEIRKRPSATKRSIPVICLVYGGGSNSVQTVEYHLEAHDPILVIRGSGRAADLLSDWKILSDERRAQLVLGREPWQENAKMRAKARAWLFAETRAAERFPGASCADDQDDHPELQDEIDSFVAQLDRIIAYPDLYYVDLYLEDSKQADSRYLGDKATRGILSTVLRAIANSSTILHKVKLPLAIRYNNQTMIKRILRDEGLCMKENGQELSADSRPLVFAAFFDQGDVAGELLDSGFDDTAIDHLILLELAQLEQLLKLRKLKSERKRQKEEVPCPASWEEQRRKENSLSDTFDERETPLHMQRENMSPEQVHKSKLERVRQDWKQVARDQQIMIAEKAASTVSWDKLPLLAGWSFQVITRIGHGTGRANPNTPHLMKRRLGLAAGARYQVKSTRLRSGYASEQNSQLWVKLISTTPPFDVYDGKLVSADTARQAVMGKFTEHQYDLGEVQWSKHLWIIVDEKSCGRVVLKQVKVDEISTALVINAPGRWPVPLGHDMESLHRATKKALAPWYCLQNIEPGLAWWQHLVATDEHCEHRVLENGLTPFLRVFWAIISGRHNIAELLYRRLNCGDRFVSAFLCSWACRKMGTSASRQLATEWDHKATQELKRMEIGGKVPPCVFDEYVYYGLREEKYATKAAGGEMTQYAMLTRKEKRDNALRRSALSLMGCHPSEPKTRVDLAIMSENKLYMAQASTKLFLDGLWYGHSWNGKWSDSLTSASPYHKWWSNTVGWVSFLMLYFYVYLSMPYVHSQPPNHWYGSPNFSELFFWGWVLANINSELRQATDDFDSFRDYIHGSGNVNDLIIIIVFVLAFCCRVMSILMIRSEAEPDGWRLCSDAVVAADRPLACNIYNLFQLLLGFNYFWCVQRLLLMLTIVKRIGVLYEIIQRILKNDVVPFLVILLSFVWSFEVHSHFFSWNLGQRQWGTRQHTDGDIGWLRGFGSYLSVVGLDTSQYPLLFDVHQGLPEWDTPSKGQLIYQIGTQIAFFLITVIVLMNLLIAMMSETYGRVTADAEAQWRTKFAGQVREYWDATLLPAPFNLIEHLANSIMESRQQARENHYSSHVANMRSLVWGQHYVWPLPDAHFRLRLRNPGMTPGESSTAHKQSLDRPATLRDLQDTSEMISAGIHKSTSQIEKSCRIVDEHSREHLVVEVADPNATVNEHHIGYRMASELGVAAVWTPGPEHSRCAVGARGDVVGENVCTHAATQSCTAECCVAVRLHADRRVVLFRKVRVAAVPGTFRSRSFTGFAQSKGEDADPVVLVPSEKSVGIDSEPRLLTSEGARAAKGAGSKASDQILITAPPDEMMDKMQALEATSAELTRQLQAMRAGMDDNMGTMRTELKQVLAALKSQNQPMELQ